MDSNTDIVSNTPSVDLALFALQNICNPNEIDDWVNIILSPYIGKDEELKLTMKVSNPTFDALPPLRIGLNLHPIQFDPENIRRREIMTSDIYEKISIDSLAEGEEVECEVFSKNHHSGLLKLPMILTVHCLPYFSSNDDNDWHFRPLYKTVFTDFDIILSREEIDAKNQGNIIELGVTPKKSEINISTSQMMPLVNKNFRDVKKRDILGSLLHYEYEKLANPLIGIVSINGSLTEVKLEMEKIVPTQKNIAYRLHFSTNKNNIREHELLKRQLEKKLQVLTTDNLVPLMKSRRPSTIFWSDKQPSTSFDFPYEAE